jgi:hypothetical protein
MPSRNPEVELVAREVGADMVLEEPEAAAHLGRILGRVLTTAAQC